VPSPNRWRDSAPEYHARIHARERGIRAVAESLARFGT
jgi:hypothetical protein